MDPNEIAHLITKIINGKLEIKAPLKKQYKNSLPPFTTSQTKQLIETRDLALATAKETGHQDDIRNYRVIRNRCHREITKDNLSSPGYHNNQH